jgi:hypothetical protein
MVDRTKIMILRQGIYGRKRPVRRSEASNSRQRKYSYNNRWTSGANFDTQLHQTKAFTELRSLKVQICTDLGLTGEINFGFRSGSSNIKRYL